MKVVRNMDVVKSRGDEVVKQIIAQAKKDAKLGHSTGAVIIDNTNGLDIDYIINSVKEQTENTVVVKLSSILNALNFSIVD